MLGTKRHSKQRTYHIPRELLTPLSIYASDILGVTLLTMEVAKAHQQDGKKWVKGYATKNDDISITAYIAGWLQCRYDAQKQQKGGAA